MKLEKLRKEVQELNIRGAVFKAESKILVERGRKVVEKSKELFNLK